MPVDVRDRGAQLQTEPWIAPVRTDRLMAWLVEQPARRLQFMGAGTVLGVVTTRDSSGGDTNVRQTIVVRYRPGWDRAR